MPDGLGMLDEKRQRRARSIPAPRNPARTTPVQVVELAASEPEQPTQAEPAEVTTTPEKAATRPSTTRPKVTRSAQPQAKPELQQPTIKMSIYLEASDDVYLENIAHAGKTGTPKVAISRSAIVRLALERLANTMTTDEIVSELRGRGDEQQGSGRKRR